MNKSKLFEMYRRFDEKLKEWVALKGQNTQFFSNETYTEMIKNMKSSKSKD